MLREITSPNLKSFPDFFNNRVVVADKVPEPSSVLGTALLGIGGAAVIVKRRLRQKLASRS
ncbi:MAG: hypothetical protein BRC53_11375 [Cyanobacteria bacterium SW_6_48_11]|nr:MAG: hypothetical protein BRC53_11375 [Cyanobacteria bacterium SW_6_48_11]